MLATANATLSLPILLVAQHQTQTAHPLGEPFVIFSVESEGFEPPDLLQSAVFKTAAIDHSASSLGQLLHALECTIEQKRLFPAQKKPFSREGGIRTPDTVAGITVFETVAFDHSATSLSGSPSDWGVQK